LAFFLLKRSFSSPCSVFSNPKNMTTKKPTNSIKLEFFTKSLHKLQRASDWQRFASALRDCYAKEFGCNDGLNRFPISGGICEHWPRSKKDNVIKAVKKQYQFMDESVWHWKRAGKTLVTWRRVKNQILG